MFVFLNMAMTADGRIATANRAVSSFGSARDKEHLLELRATADAVMAGARTVDLNPVNMGPGPARLRRLRLKRGLAEYNLRLIVSGSASLNPQATVFQKKFSPVIVLVSGQAAKRKIKQLEAAGAEVNVFGTREIDFRKALQWLERERGVRRLLCEGGGEVNDGLFRAGLVDELHLTVCPMIFGGRAAPTIVEGQGFPRLSQAVGLQLKSRRRIGDELFLVYSVLR